METEVLIVGNGISGIMLGNSLLERKIPFITIDQGFDAATTAAAGICNPIVFRRMNKSWKSDELLPIAEQNFQSIEATLGGKYLEKTRIIKLIRSKDEHDQWLQAMNDTEVMDYISIEEISDLEKDQFKNLLYKGVVSPALQVDLKKLKADFEKYLTKKEIFRKETFTHDKVKFSSSEVKWGNISAKQIVFCEGSGIKTNPFFNYLPLNPVKGEAIIVKIPGLKTSEIYNNKVAICPIGEETFWVGGTYQWDELDFLPSGKGQEELIHALKKTTNLEFEVLDQIAGIRPSVKDRRPLVGQHPEIKNAWVLNGMGTKGTMLSPYCADELAAAMYDNKALNPEINCDRYSDLLSK